MYRYGDGTPFPLEENFIETLTSAVQACTNAFLPLAELDSRRERARDTKREAEREATRLDDLDRTLSSSLAPYISNTGGAAAKQNIAQAVAQKLALAFKQAISEAKRQLEARVRESEAQAVGRTSSSAILKALAPFFEGHALPKTSWIMSWDVRGTEPHADAVSTAGRLTASFTLSPDPFRVPIRVDQLADGVIVHMLKRGVFGKAKPAPIDLGKYVMVAFERGTTEMTVTLKENPSKPSPGLRFAVADNSNATWTAISVAGDAEGDANPLDIDDVAPIRQLVDRANAALKDLINRRTLVELTLNNKSISELEEPRIVPLEVLNQLTPLARSIRERSRMSGELVLKRDIGDGRREELFVPRATLAQQFLRLPPEYQRPFEEMGITNEETQPAITLPSAMRPPARTSQEPTIEIDTNKE